VLWPMTVFTCGTYDRRDQLCCTRSSSTRRGQPWSLNLRLLWACVCK